MVILPFVKQKYIYVIKHLKLFGISYSNVINLQTKKQEKK